MRHSTYHKPPTFHLRSRRLLPWLLALATLIATIPLATPRAHAADPIALGAAIQDWGLEAPCDAAAIDNFSNLTGRTPAIVMEYQTWSETYNTFPGMGRCMDNVRVRGGIGMVTWEPWDGNASNPAYRLTAIARGDYDAYIRQYAADAKAWGHPFLLRFAHEMNGNWYPWGVGPRNPDGNTSTDYVAAWRHVHDIFAQVGATNVRWVWSPNTISTNSPLSPDTYPGDAYVDWIGMDGYNVGVSEGWNGWLSLVSIFAPTYNALTTLTNKPIMIAETGSTESGGDKAAWITQGLLSDLSTGLPRVRAVVWFDKDKETDWRVNSSPSALAAYRTVVASPLYQGQLLTSNTLPAAAPSNTPNPVTSTPTTVPAASTPAMNATATNTATPTAIPTNTATPPSTPTKVATATGTPTINAPTRVATTTTTSTPAVAASSTAPAMSTPVATATSTSALTTSTSAPTATSVASIIPTGAPASTPVSIKTQIATPTRPTATRTGTQALPTMTATRATGSPVSYGSPTQGHTGSTTSVLPTATPPNLPVPSGNSGEWRLDEGSGTIANDTSGNGNSGTLRGKATWSTGIAGKSAVSLDGSSGYVDIHRTVVDTSKSYSVAASVNLTKTSAWQTAVSIDGLTGSGFYLQYCADCHAFAFSVRNLDSSTSTPIRAIASSAPITGRWYHLIGVYNATNRQIKLYVDGILQSTQSYDSGWRASGDTVIGRARWLGVPVEYWAGPIDDIQLYPRALSQQEIQNLANS